MKQNEELTNEELTKLFTDNFQLALHSISMARNHVKAGQETSMQSVLKEVKKNSNLHSFEDHVLDKTNTDQTNQ